MGLIPHKERDHVKNRWIRFSDFDVGNKNDDAVDTYLMGEQLKSYIPKSRYQFGYMLCSGDVKEWSNDYGKAISFISELRDVCVTPKDRLFVVPGNHAT